MSHRSTSELLTGEAYPTISRIVQELDGPYDELSLVPWELRVARESFWQGLGDRVAREVVDLAFGAIGEIAESIDQRIMRNGAN